MEDNKLECEECGQDYPELTSKSKFMGNKDDRFLCSKCYQIIHNEPSEEKINVQTTKNEVK